MHDFVSTRWIRGVAMMASMPVAWAIFIPDGFSPDVAWVILSLSAAFWLGRRSTRWIAQVSDQDRR